MELPPRHAGTTCADRMNEMLQRDALGDVRNTRDLRA